MPTPHGDAPAAASEDVPDVTPAATGKRSVGPAADVHRGRRLAQRPTTYSRTSTSCAVDSVTG